MIQPKRSLVLPCLTAFLLLIGMAPITSFAQQDRSERIRESEYDTVFIINDFDVVIDDITRMADDLNLGFVKPYITQTLQSKNTGISRSAGMTAYSDNLFNGPIIEFAIEDRQLVEKIFENAEGKPIDDGLWRTIKENVEIPTDNFGNSKDIGLISGGRLIVGDDASEEAAKRVLKGKPLAPKMDAISHDIINRSGLVFLADNKNVASAADWSKRLVLEPEYKDLTDSERTWLEELWKKSNTAEFGLVGLKYHTDQVFEIRAQAKLKTGSKLNELFDFENAKKEWVPDLGFEKQQLAGCIAIKLDAFPSPAGPKALPKVLLKEFGKTRGLEFLRGDTINILLNLVGDSWNDLSVARLGIYENDNDEKAGQYAIISVVDTKDSGAVIDELKRITRLTMPIDEATKAKREAEKLAEIALLIEELGSADIKVAGRAQSRLYLTKEAGAAELKKVIDSLPDNAAKRARQIINYGERQAKKDAKRKAVMDPSFWTTLNPGLAFKENVGEVQGFPMHIISVTPDPSKTPEEVKKAVGIMQYIFGPKWNTIPVVEVNDHFVFMIGSDIGTLGRVVKNVDKESSKLKPYFNEVGFGPQKGDVQSFVNAIRMNKLLGQNSKFNLTIDEKNIDDDVCWIGIKFYEESIALDCLVPLPQIRPFAQIGW